MTRTEWLALLALGLLVAGLVLVPLLLMWSRGRRSSRGSSRSLPGRFGALATTVAQTVSKSLFLAQVGMISQVTVAAIGYLRVWLRPSAGAEILALGEEEPPVVALHRDLQLEMQHRRDPPASYRGAAVDLVPLLGPERLELVVEAEGFEVEQGGLAGLDVGPAGISGTRLTVRPVKSGPAALRIDCYRGNAWLQSVDLRVEVRTAAEVAALKREGTPAAGLEGSATVPAAPPEPAPRHLHLRIFRAGDPETGRAYRARMSDGRGGWRSLDLRLQEEDLREINRGLRLALEDLRRFLGDAVALDPEARSSPEYRDRLDKLARRGYYAFQQIFAEPADQDYVRAALQAAETGGGAGLEIATQGFFLPWEALCDTYDPAAAPDPRGFWGFRHAISRVLTDVRQSAAPVLECDGPPRVSLFADPELPAVAAEEAPHFQRLSEEGRIALRQWQEGSAGSQEVTERERRARVVEFSLQPADVAHFACHAVAAEYGPDSYLRLPDDLRLRLEDMAVERYFLAGEPFVVLNACGTGIRDPLKTSDFVHRFLLCGGRGVLVTECDIPDGFAAAFVRRLYERILAGEPLVAALRAVRAHFLDEHGNPLGLLYSAYLPLEARLLRRS